MERISPASILRDLRGDRKLEEVARAVGVGESSISMYELGQRTPRDDVKRKLANFYGKTVQEIFFPDDGHPENPERNDHDYLAQSR